MKKFIFSVVICLAASVFAFAQSKFPELEKIKQIKLLESTREDVKRIFADYEESVSALNEYSTFSKKNFWIRVEYSGSGCNYDDWNVTEGKVEHIMIFLDKAIEPESLGIDLSRLRKEREFVNSSEDFIYYDKTAGIRYDVCNGRINTIEFFPPKEKLSLLCNNQNEIKKFYQDKRWSNKKLKKPFVRNFASVMEVSLSTSEIIAGCDSNNKTDAKSCADGVMQIEVSVDANASPCTSWDFIYNYTISGGKITGSGANVVWDLTGVKPGNYTITAGVDNGCGVCGTTRTKTVTVKDYPDCAQKPK